VTTRADLGLASRTRKRVTRTNQTTIETRAKADNEADLEVGRSLLTKHGGSLTFETESGPRNDVFRPSPRGDSPRRAPQASCVCLALRGSRAECPGVAIAASARAPCRGKSCCPTGDAFGTKVAPTNTMEKGEYPHAGSGVLLRGVILVWGRSPATRHSERMGLELMGYLASLSPEPFLLWLSGPSPPASVRAESQQSAAKG